METVFSVITIHRGNLLKSDPPFVSTIAIVNDIH